MIQLVVSIMHTKDYKHMILIKNLKSRQKETAITQYPFIRRFLTCYLYSISKIAPRHLYLLVIPNHHHRPPLPP